MDNNEYSLGNCAVCGKNRPLQNGKCIECQEKVDIPDIFKDIFGGFKDGSWINKEDGKYSGK